LTAIRSVGEVGLVEGVKRAYREIIGSMLEEADRWLLVDRLLVVSCRCGQGKLSTDVVDLSTLASEVVEQLDVLADEKNQSLGVDIKAQPTWIGDRLVLRQAVLNLVDNAIKYSPEGAQITVRVDHQFDDAILEVSDNGPGIPEELQPRIFDRFYRVGVSIPQQRRNWLGPVHCEMGG
jgi:signal transduction histidine kinase